MASLTRSAKSGSEWSRNKLFAYNIFIQSVPVNDFFPAGPEPSLDHLHPALFTSLASDCDPAFPPLVTDYLGYLDPATAQSAQESTIDDFVVATLRLLGFNDLKKLILTHYDVPLWIFGDTTGAAETDVCLVHCPTVILPIIQDEITGRQKDLEARITAGAIATFQFNNQKRSEMGLARLPKMTIPAITMYNTCPTFYLIPVTEELSDAVITGQYPATPTFISKCVTAPTHASHASIGMKDRKYRKVALRRLLAFKDLAHHYWSEILVDL